MCSKACLDFGEANLPRQEIEGKEVIEIGAIDVNGTLRPFIKSLNPAKYIGVDIEEGEGVDVICDIYELTRHFGKESFDVVISTEVMEHIQDWRKALSELKNIVRPGGFILLTTRSKGFPYHGYPYDFWRFEVEDMKAIFADMNIEVLESDRVDPGVFLKVRKPPNFAEKDLRSYELFSMVTNNKSKEIEFSKLEYFRLKCRTSFLVRKLKGAKRKLMARF